MERILVFVDDLRPATGTAEASVVADALRDRGCQVKVVELQRQSKRFCSTTCQQLAKTVRQFQPDQIHCWGPGSISAGAMLRTGGSATRVAVHSSACALVDRHQGWKQRVEFARFDRHLIRHEMMLDAVHSVFPRWRVDVLPWSEPTATASRPIAELKQILGVPVEAKLVGTATAMVHGTRLKDFIWAADLLTCIRDDVYWLLIGEGAQEWRLRRFASQLEVGNHLQFVGWHELASEIISALDVYVEPSTFFEGSTGLAQAVSYGVPAIATSAPIHLQLARQGFNSLVVERGARNEIARCVNRLVNQPAIAKRYSVNAKAVAGEALASPADLASVFLNDRGGECSIAEPVSLAKPA